ncbi:MAG: YcnI family protein [Actinomycetota bacterium]
MKLGQALILTTVVALVTATAASGHVTLNPEKAPADSFTRFALRVPTEEDVPTVKVSVQLPEGLDEVSFQPKPGWKRTQNGRVVTWSGGEIGPGEFDEFGLSTHLPNTPGETLVFPATQTYASGKVMHWIGALTSDEPAPHVLLEAAEGTTPTTTTTTAASETTDEGEDGDDAALWIAIAALIAGVAALGLGVVRWRRA